MKFYTPDLYRRTQSDDNRVLNAADEEWERANEVYEQHLAAIRPLFTPGMLALDGLLLHDAILKSLARLPGKLLTVLHKDIPPRDLVLLEYDLVGEPVFEPYADELRPWSAWTDFQFDEVDAVPGDPIVFIQEIVFGNGWLLRLRFRDVRVTLAEPLVLPTVSASADTPAVQPA